MQLEITDDLEALLTVLPPRVQEPLSTLERQGDLLEVVLDLGRPAEARVFGEDITLAGEEVTEEELQYVVNRIGAFGDDNRAGIARTLHRISAIRNREGHIVGLTCRVGRAVYGTIDIVRDIVESGKSILLLGRPGVGKTTMLREVARVLAKGKRVIIVDTSNEIGGDGDIPHPAIGRARRMQVITPTMQHAVMIEAVENHMPEVIVIDEIGTELEAAAARTIAERGVQLVGTAHGNSLENLMMNPTLADLVGGIQSVTLSDEEARRRGTQKSVLERKAPPTFELVVEIQDWGRVAVRHDVAQHVDAILRGRTLPVEMRYRDEKGEVQFQEQAPRPLPEQEAVSIAALSQEAEGGAVSIYPYGISQSHLRQAARGLNAQLEIVGALPQADVLMTTKAYYRRRPKTISEAERRGIPIYVLRSNTLSQVESVLGQVLNQQGGQEPRRDPFAEAMAEARDAIRMVIGEASAVELSPQNAYIRRLQHQLAEQSDLQSRSRGREPYRRVLILPSRGR